MTLITIACAVGGVVAGIFSSSIVATTNIEVLLSSPNCGFWSEDMLALNESLQGPWDNDTNHFYQQGVADSKTYARSCYNASSLKTCNTFSVPTIDWTTNYDAPCPFEGMCVGSAMEMDTGMVNTNDILGINFPKSDQFKFRRVTTCAPMVQDGYVTSANSTSIPGDEIMYYDYGATQEGGVVKANYTWQASVYASNLTRTYTLGYVLSSLHNFDLCSSLTTFAQCHSRIQRRPRRRSMVPHHTHEPHRWRRNSDVHLRQQRSKHPASRRPHLLCSSGGRDCVPRRHLLLRLRHQRHRMRRASKSSL